MTTTAICQRKVLTRTHPMTLILMRMSFWGPLANISIPRGHSDDSIALVISPGDDDL